eukprot:12897952-Prorocentrum_lima.AAC.1
MRKEERRNEKLRNRRRLRTRAAPAFAADVLGFRGGRAKKLDRNLGLSLLSFGIGKYGRGAPRANFARNGQARIGQSGR